MCHNKYITLLYYCNIGEIASVKWVTKSEQFEKVKIKGNV